MRVTKDMIAPELRLPGAIMRFVFGGERSIEQLRKPDNLMMRLLAKLPARGMDKDEVRISRPDGSALRLIILKPPEPNADAPAVLWLHGGGYSMGSVEAEYSQMRTLIKHGKCMIVSPEYRLSKYAPYPAALDDCYAALVWLKDSASSLGCRGDQIIVAGGSAGGGLTAAVSLLARDREEVKIAFQMPLYPMIDDRGLTPSMMENDAPVYDAISNESNWRIYLGDLYAGDVPAYAAPARAVDFGGLPPTITFVGGVDPFRDETIAYVEALKAAGVPVEFREYPGAWHGFDGIAPWTSIAKQANHWLLSRFEEYLSRYFAEQPVRVIVDR